MDILSVREEFPIKRKRVYLNNASIGPLSIPVISNEEELRVLEFPGHSLPSAIITPACSQAAALQDAVVIRG